MGVYVHIPFCAQKCYYCDFYSVVVSEDFPTLAGNYLVSLRQEALYYRKIWGEQPLDSLFIGGGTPSVIPPEELAGLVSWLLKELPFVAEPEVTMEANPHSLTAAGVEVLSAAGVNRISLGVQAFQNNLLKSIGRIHRAEQIGESVEALRKAGVDNINLDLMFGLPGQRVQDWLNTLESALALEPAHLSCYGLILEENTPMEKWVSEGLMEVPNDDGQAEMYEAACRILKGSGYEHYEISNFALPGKRSSHNLLYWQNKPFIGLGSGATGYIGGNRYRNIPDLWRYMQSWHEGGPLYEDCDQVSVEREMDETMMVGMRLLAGVDEASFCRRYGISFWELYQPAINDLLARGLVEWDGAKLRVTRLGLFLENQVSAAFLR
ncbi:MAG: radical SAM family heme chaperone HemW [Firmicutes bacterium]|nr:radical SAM family heme chaperone HemW [Bacillota bacterium]